MAMNHGTLHWGMSVEEFDNEYFYAADLKVFARSASRELDQLDAATRPGDMARPGNRLEALKGWRRGQWSIRVNDQWRICFRWPEGSPGPTEEEIVDYR